MILIGKMPRRPTENQYVIAGNQYLWHYGGQFLLTSYANVMGVSEIYVFASDSKGEVVNFSEIEGERNVEDTYENHVRLAHLVFHRDLVDSDT